MKHVTRRDILAPANIITCIGAACVVMGALHLTSWIGLGLVALGKAFDLVDGAVARRTHTSTFGAAFDATTDKLTTGIILFAAWRADAAPATYLLYVLAVQVIIAGMATVAHVRQTQLRVTRFGKYNMFIQTAALLMFIAASISSGALSAVLTSLAAIVSISSMYTCYQTIRGYYDQLKVIEQDNG